MANTANSSCFSGHKAAPAPASIPDDRVKKIERLPGDVPALVSANLSRTPTAFYGSSGIPGGYNEHSNIKIFFILCVAFLYLIDMFTLKKAGSSGNENPAFLCIIPYLFSSLYLAYFINKYIPFKCNTNRRITLQIRNPVHLARLGFLLLESSIQENSRNDCEWSSC